MSRMSVKIKRLGAITVAAALIVCQSPLCVTASSSGARGKSAGEGSMTVTAFESLSDSIATQKLTVGAKESDITFPGSLSATVRIESSGGESGNGSGQGTDNGTGTESGTGSEQGTGTEPGAGTDNGNSTQSGTGDENGNTENGTSGSGNSENGSAEGISGENTGSESQESGQTQENTDNTEQSGNPDSQTEGEQPGSSQEEGGKDSASAGSFMKYMSSFASPLTVYAAENNPAEGTQTTKDLRIEGITWKIDTAKSTGESFSSDKAGNTFVYLPILPQEYKAEAQLPSIKVIIEKAAEEAVSRNEYGEVEYTGDKKEKTTINDYLAVHSSNKKVEWKNDWYVLGENAEITGEINISGNVNLILTDGHTLKVSKSRITADKDAALKIYGQENGTGTLSVKFADEKDNEDEAQIASEGKTMVEFSDADLAVFGGTVDIDAVNGTAISADNVAIAGGNVNAKGAVGVCTSTILSVSGGKTVISSIGSEKEKSADVILSITDKNDSLKIEGPLFHGDKNKVQIADKVILTDGKDIYRGEYGAETTPSYMVFANSTLTMAVLEPAPKAALSASGTQSGKLKGFIAGEKYIISGAGLEQTELTAADNGTYTIASGLKSGDLQIVKKAKEGTFNSDPQVITVTKAANPPKPTAKACTTAANNDGMITGLVSTERYEYRSIDATKYTAVAVGATSITGLKDGTYYVRIRPVGAMLASGSHKVVIAPFSAGKVEAPVFSPKGGTYTASQNVTLTSKTEGATIYYTVDGTVPTTSSKVYSGSISVTGKATIKAFAVKKGMTNSTLATATYSISSMANKSTTGTTYPKTSTSKSKAKTSTYGNSTISKSSTSKSTSKSAYSSEDEDSFSRYSGNSYSYGRSSASRSRQSGTESSSNKPYVEGNPGQEGWDAIIGKLGRPDSEKKLRINMNGESEVPSGTIEEIRGRNITLVFNIGDGITWSVNGLDVKGRSLNDVDLGVEMDTDCIPEEVMDEVTGGIPGRQLSLDYDGEFGFTAVLTLDMDPSDAGLFANLFYYNPDLNKLEFVSSGRIGDDGLTDLMFSHASDYMIVVNEEPMGVNTMTTHVTADADADDDTLLTDDDALAEDDDIFSADPDMLLAEADPDADDISEDVFADFSDMEMPGLFDGFDFAPLITVIVAAILIIAVIIACLRNKKKASV